MHDLRTMRKSVMVMHLIDLPERSDLTVPVPYLQQDLRDWIW